MKKIIFIFVLLPFAVFASKSPFYGTWSGATKDNTPILTRIFHNGHFFIDMQDHSIIDTIGIGKIAANGAFHFSKHQCHYKGIGKLNKLQALTLKGVKKCKHDKPNHFKIVLHRLLIKKNKYSV